MRRAISLALTGALIVSMGVAAFAVGGISSKTVQDIINVEVTAPSGQEQTKFDYKATTAKTEASSASQTTAASSSASSSTASSSSTAESGSKEVEDVLGNIMKNMDTVISVGQKTGTTATTDTASSTAASSSSSTSTATSASTNRKVNPLASTNVTITTNNMKDDESGVIELKSGQTEAVQAATEVYAVAAVPVIDPATGEQKVENGEPVFRYVHVPAVIRNGKVQAVFTNAILKQIGTNNFVLTAFIVTETSTQAASK